MIIVTESFLFAWHKETTAYIYIGTTIGKPIVLSVIQKLTTHLGNLGSPVPSRTVAQLQNIERKPEAIFGIAIDTTGTSQLSRI